MMLRPLQRRPRRLRWRAHAALLLPGEGGNHGLKRLLLLQRPLKRLLLLQRPLKRLLLL